MEEETIEAVKIWPESQSVRDIQVFLGFANFYKRFIRNFSKIAASLTLILWITGNNDLDAQANGHKENQNTIAGASGTDDGGVGESIKNLSIVANLAKSKKSILTKSKKSDLPKANFAKVNSGTNFHTPEAKKPSYTYESLLPRLWFLSILI